MRFVGVNQRDDVSQLEAGEVRESLNGRIDGYWQPRRGVELRSGALSSTVVPLQLPFWLVDAVGGDAITGAELADDVVTLEVVGHGMEGGFDLSNTGLFDFGGDTADGGYTLEETLDGKPSYQSQGGVCVFQWDSTPGRWRFFINGFQAAYSDDDVARPDLAVWRYDSTTALAPFFFSLRWSPSWLEVRGLGFATTNPNGLRLVTPVDVDTLTYPLVGADEVFTIGGGDDKVLVELNDSAVGDIYGSCMFSDPADSLEESIVIAGGLEARKVRLSDYSVSGLTYPEGTMLGGEVEMLQCFDRVILFREGLSAWEWIPGGRPVSSSAVVSNVVTVTLPTHGLTTGDEVVLSGLTFTGTDPNGTRVVTVASADTFTFALTTANETHGVASAKVVVNGFTKVVGGVYAVPQSFSVREDDVVVADGYATLTVSGNTTIRSGDRIRMYGSEIGHFTDFVGREYLVSEADATSVRFPIAAGDYTSAGTTDYLYVGKNAPQGLGFIHMPGAPWGVYFQRRLWVPYFYEPGGTAASPTFADRDIRDEIVASDILDSDTYDRVYSQFRVTAGIADHLVGLQPFFNDGLLVLMRNSLHLLAGTQGSLEDTVVTELTKEVGCLARRSVVGIGSAVFFLSDNGVYGVEFIDQYNLRGIQEPLSKPIQGYIDRINADLAAAAVGVYFNNRYFLAVPLDSAPKVGDAQGNNSVLVFNVLNRAWESVDTYGVGNFNIRRWHIGAAGERNALYMVNEFGGIHECDATNTPVDRLSFNSLGEATTHDIDYKLVTRGYTHGTYERKKFHEAQITLRADIEAVDAIIDFSTEDPDTDSYQVGQASVLLGNDIPGGEQATLRVRLGNTRGHHGSLTIRALDNSSIPVGRPKVTSVAIEATVTNRATISQQ